MPAVSFVTTKIKSMVELLSDEYRDGYDDGYCGNGYKNIYAELTLQWLEYDKGYDDGLKAWDGSLGARCNAL